MSDKTAIEWTDATWNPVTGCDEVSPGCDNCYAKTFAERFRGTPGHYFEQGFDIVLRPDKLDQPLRWTRPRRIFVNSMSDLFHKDVDDDFIAEVFAVMALTPRHTFQLLTKRHGRMSSLLSRTDFVRDVELRAERTWHDHYRGDGPSAPGWPLPNVWLGVSVEDQQRANLRIPALLDTPAAVRWISAEPLLGPVDLRLWAGTYYGGDPREDEPGVDWVVAGGESGRGARPMHPQWARSLRDQCAAAGIPFLFKQRGEWTWNEPGDFQIPREPFTDRVAVMHPAGMTAMRKGNPFNPFERGHPNWATRIERVGKKRAGRLLDGRTHDKYPEESR